MTFVYLFSKSIPNLLHNITVDMNNNRSFTNKKLELQCGRRERDCQEQGSQERIERKARTKRGSKIINVRVSLSAAQINPDTDFSMNEN